MLDSVALPQRALTKPLRYGAGCRDRTRDPLITNHRKLVEEKGIIRRQGLSRSLNPSHSWN